MNILVVDSDPRSKSLIRQSLSSDSAAVLLHCETVGRAQEVLNHHQVDLVIMETELPDGNGIDFIRTRPDFRPLVIFMSPKNDYAIDAFELHATDYLLKPFHPGRVTRALAKARLAHTSQSQVQLRKMPEEDLFIRDSNIIRRLRIDEILYAEAMGDYVKIVMRDRIHAIHTTFATVQGRLPSDKFLKVHRSFIVAINKIDTLQDRELMINGKSLPVALTYKQMLNDRMNILA